MTDFNELRNKYNRDIKSLEEEEQKIKEQINVIKGKRLEALKGLVKTDENKIIWAVNVVSNRSMPYIHAMYFSKEGASNYKDGESIASNDGFEWHYKVSKVTIDSIPECDLEKIED